jgi:hypothetical protein
MSSFKRLERVSLIVLWLMILIVVCNFDHFPVAIYHGQYFVRGTLGPLSFQQALPYLLMECGFFVAAGLYLLVRIFGRLIQPSHRAPDGRRDA